jgi:hypothetical protein
MSQRTVAHIRPHSLGEICKLYSPGGLGLILISIIKQLFTNFNGELHSKIFYIPSYWNIF